MIKGSCLCGAVAFQIEGALHSARYCHCTNCRKFSGTAYAARALAQAAQLAVTASEAAVTKYDSGGGLRVFCASCGCPLWYEPNGLPQFRGIPLGVIDGVGAPKPEMHVWTKSMVGWATISDDLPIHENHP
jgi:hypothetical protein